MILSPNTYPLFEYVNLIVSSSGQMRVETTSSMCPDIAKVREAARDRYRITITLGTWTKVDYYWSAKVTSVLGAKR